MKNSTLSLFIFLLLTNPVITSGQSWSNAGNSFVCPYGVNTLLTYNNDLYAGGVTQITKWNGSSWSNLITVQTIGVDEIWCMAVYNGELYIGGDFSWLGITASHIVKWNGSSFSAVGNGLTGTPSGMGVYNGELIACGYNGQALYNGHALVKWNGTNWAPLGNNNGITGYATDFLVYNGTLHVCGTFSAIGGITANNIARWNGTAWSSLGSGTNWSAHSMAIYNNDLYVGGYFTGAGGLVLDNIAKWNGSTWSAVGGGILGPSYGSTTGTVRSMAAFKGDLYVAGEFSVAGTTPAWNIAKWNGTNWYDIGGITGGGVCGGTYGLCVYNNSELFVGGLFDSAGTIPAINIAIYSGEQTSVPAIPGAICGLSVYPNPVVSAATLSFETLTDKPYRIVVSDVTGRTWISENRMSMPGRNTAMIATRHLPSGIYTIQVLSEDRILQSKIIHQ